MKIQTTLTKEDIDRKSESLVYGYAKRFPGECEGYLRAAERMRRETGDVGMTPHGTMMCKAHIPPRLFQAARKFWGQEWQDDKIVSLMKVARKFCINASKVSRVQESQPIKEVKEITNRVE